MTIFSLSYNIINFNVQYVSILYRSLIDATKDIESDVDCRGTVSGIKRQNDRK